MEITKEYINQAHKCTLCGVMDAKVTKIGRTIAEGDLLISHLNEIYTSPLAVATRVEFTCGTCKGVSMHQEIQRNVNVSIKVTIDT